MPSNQRGASSQESRDRNTRGLAVYHARRIQRQAEAEVRILEATETLLEFPSNGTDAMCPSEQDVNQVKALLQSFQPADYDALVQERIIDGRCGYVLCPRPHRSEDTNAKFRIINDKERGRGAFKVVDRADLEKWCSDTCGKRALYLRLQLSETPAWERQSANPSELKLYDEKATQSNNRPEKTDVRSLVRDLDQLALERCDKSANSFRSDTLQVSVREKDSSEAPEVPSKSEDHSTVDGYIPGSAHALASKFNRLVLDNDGDGGDIMDLI